MASFSEPTLRGHSTPLPGTPPEGLPVSSTSWHWRRDGQRLVLTDPGGVIRIDAIREAIPCCPPLSRK